MRLAVALLIPSLSLFASNADGQTPTSDPAPAQPPAVQIPEQTEPEEQASATPSIPLAEDTLKGRFHLSLMGGLFVPFGSLESDIAWRKSASLGPGGELEAALGVSRSVVIGAWLHAAQFGGGDDCDTCSTTSLAGGPLIRFHLVQGFKLDPWVSMGLGLRSMAIDAETDANYTGIDWLRVTVGGDWYASRNVAVGPYVQLLGGATINRPESPPAGERPFDDHGAIYWTFSAGLGLTLALPRR